LPTALKGTEDERAPKRESYTKRERDRDREKEKERERERERERDREVWLEAKRNVLEQK
jgi:hypothetical protein